MILLTENDFMCVCSCAFILSNTKILKNAHFISRACLITHGFFALCNIIFRWTSLSLSLSGIRCAWAVSQYFRTMWDGFFSPYDSNLEMKRFHERKKWNVYVYQTKPNKIYEQHQKCTHKICATVASEMISAHRARLQPTTHHDCSFFLVRMQWNEFNAQSCSQPNEIYCVNKCNWHLH